MNALSDQALIERMRELVKEERRVTTLVLRHLREVERRRLFSDLGYSSLFEYAVKDLSYSESSAQRRISAMRLIKEIPEIESKIESGALSLTVVSQAARHFRHESTPREEKRAVLELLEGRSSREAERELAVRSSSPLPEERVRAVGEHHSELRVVLKDETLEDFEKLKGLLGHSHPEMTTAELLAYMAKETLKRLDPAREPMKKRRSKELVSASQVTPQHIPRSLKRRIWRRDRGRCTNCRSAYRLQLDHILPRHRGGVTTETNLRLLCFHCNQRHADCTYGRPRMERYRLTTGPPRA
jgi:5-methylcytosine-specific restriction endonuclease McrA